METKRRDVLISCTPNIQLLCFENLWTKWTLCTEILTLKRENLLKRCGYYTGTSSVREMHKEITLKSFG